MMVNGGLGAEFRGRFRNVVGVKNAELSGIMREFNHLRMSAEWGYGSDDGILGCEADCIHFCK
jgi:hypothetical protein